MTKDAEEFCSLALDGPDCVKDLAAGPSFSVGALQCRISVRYVLCVSYVGTKRSRIDSHVWIEFRI